MFLFLFWGGNAAAQTVHSLLDIVDTTTVTLTSTGQAQLNQYNADTSINVLAFAEINSVAQAVSPQGRLKLELPGLLPETFFNFTGGDNESNYYSWYGIGDNPSSTSSTSPEGVEFFYSRRNNRNLGFFTIDTSYYQYMHIDNDHVVIFEPKPSPSPHPTGGCATPDTIATGGQNFNSHDPFEGIEKFENPCFSNGEVSILILYTDQADAESPNIEDVARLSFNQLRRALYNTGVDRSNLTVELNDIAPLPVLTPGFVESNNIVGDRNFLRSNATINQFRDNQNADLVVVLTSNAYEADGIADLGLVETNYLAIAKQVSAASKKTFAHEVGHLLNLWHNTATTSETINRGYDFKTGTFPFREKHGTLMATQSSINGNPEARRIIQFSNPLKLFKGTWTGKEDEHDAQEYLDVSGPLVADYRAAVDEPMTAYINSSPVECPCTEITVTANITCPNGALSFLWERSLDNVNYTSVSFNSYYTYTTPCSEKSENIRLTVTDDNGSSTTTTTIHTIASLPFCSSNIRNDTDDQDVDIANDLDDFQQTFDVEPIYESSLVYPNPIHSGEKFTVSLEADSSEPVAVRIFDSNMRQLKRSSIRPSASSSPDKRSVTMSTQGFITGVHYAIITAPSGEIISTHKFFVLQ